MTGILVSCIFVLLAVSSSVIALFGKQLGERSAKLGIGSAAICFLASVYLLFEQGHGHPVLLTISIPSLYWPSWFSLSAYVDRLSAIMMMLIAGVSTIVQTYSSKYLQGEVGYTRFFALLGTLTLVLLALVSSGNLFLLLVWWQLVSWLLYLLLSYNFKNRSAVHSAFASLVTLRLGDIAFLVAVFLTYQTFGTLQFPDLFDRLTTTHILQLWSGGPHINAITAITLLIFLGAMTKSAQFPFHGWLPNTMDAPTPVSAFMHAGIVNAGGFLINRLAPLYGLAPTTLHLAFLVGLVTTITGTAIMLTRTDIKTKLGFSTVGQMGFMIMECGLGAFALAIFHLIAHGLFKATLFLHAGNVIHDVRREPKLPHDREQHGNQIMQSPWTTGVAITLVVPLMILFAAHAILGFHMYQGTIIFLFFAWVTSAQAIMSLYSLRVYGSWKAVFAMISVVALVIVTYLWAAESFTEFLYPAPGAASSYFHAASFPLWAFDIFVGFIVLLFIFGWFAIRPGTKITLPVEKQWSGALVHLYFLLWKGLHVERIFSPTWLDWSGAVRRLDALLPEWIP